MNEFDIRLESLRIVALASSGNSNGCNSSALLYGADKVEKHLKEALG